MNTAAQTLSEAIDALDRTEELAVASMRAARSSQEELAKARAFFKQLSDMFMVTRPKESTAAHDITESANMPATFVNRVSRIFEESNKELKTKEVVTLYELKGWPPPEKGSMYNGVSGTIAYLYSRKKLLDRNDKGYFMKASKFSTNRG